MGEPVTSATPLGASAPLVLLLALGLGTGEAWAGMKESAEDTMRRFASTSLLFENTFSVAHGTNFDPIATRSWTQIRRLNLAMDVVDELRLTAGIGVQRFLFEEWTTFANETLWEDATLGATVTVPTPKVLNDVEFPLYGAFGILTSLPTSKASIAETLILSPAIWGEGAVTAPLSGGWAWGYRFTAAPRLHRYTTYAYATPRPCSPANGCTLGASTDTGWLNTRLQLTHGVYTAFTTLSDMLSITMSMDVTYGFLYPKSESPTYGEEILSTPGNPNGGTPVSLNSSFLFDVTFAPHDSFAVGVGVWTPGSFRPNGGWYNPVINRWSQIYVDLTFYPVEFGLGVASLAKNVAKKDSAGVP